jgi:hypothetical protein
MEFFCGLVMSAMKRERCVRNQGTMIDGHGACSTGWIRRSSLHLCTFISCAMGGGPELHRTWRTE